MSQHDYNIANATFPNVRTDLNNALGAVATNNSGDSQPATTYANQWWYETDNNKLYIRNEDNDAWIHILTLNQTNDTVASLEGASSLAGIDDQSSSNDDQITITDSAVIINEDSDDLDTRIESNGNANMLFVDGGNDHINIGTATDLGGVLNVAGTAVIQTADNTDTLTLVSTDADGNQGPILNFKRDSSSPADDDILGQLTFTGENSASEAIEFVRIRAGMADVTDGTEDSRYTITTFTGGSQFGRLNIEALETVFNENSTDVDFRVESNSYANCLFVDGGNDRVGIGESTDIGGLFRVSLGDSGVTGVDAGGQGIVIEDNASAGLTIATPNDAEGGIKFADPQDNDVGRINYDHSTDAMFFMTSGNEQLRITADGKIGFKESSPEGSDGSLTLNQAGGDTQIISMKSSDVAHGMTSIAEADTYGFLKKSG